MYVFLGYILIKYFIKSCKYNKYIYICSVIIE